jgi:hypothetical protein
MSWKLLTRTGSWGHYVSSAPGTDMPTLKPGDWKVMSDQAFIRKDNAGTIAGITPSVEAVAPKPGTAGSTFSATITGNGLTGTTGVTYGGTACTAISVTNAQQLTCTFPSKTAGAYPVVVTTPVGSSSPHQYPVA